MAPRASDRKGASGVSAIDQHAYHPQTIALVTLLLGQILRADYVPEAKIDFGPDLRQLSAALSQGEEGPSREKVGFRGTTDFINTPSLTPVLDIPNIERSLRGYSKPA